MRKSAILVGVLLFGLAAPIGAQDKPGRYVVYSSEFVDFILNFTGRDSKPTYTPTKTIMRLDTQTGRTWIYRALLIVEDGKTAVRQYGWVPVPQYDSDQWAKIAEMDMSKPSEIK